MPQYNWNPSDATANFETFPKGEYEVQVGEPKAFIKKNRKGEDSYGVRYSFRIADGEYEGKRGMFTIYMHSEGGQNFGKQFLLAGLGYGRDAQEERRFNEEHGGDDWNYDPETGAVGDGWRAMTGQRMILSMDVTKGEDDREYQDVNGARRLEIAA